MFQYYLQLQDLCEESAFRYCTETLLLLFIVVLCVLLVFVVALNGFFNGYIAVYVFSGHGVNHGSCTSDNIITAVIHHHPSVSTTIIAREVLAEQQGQFLVTDALLLDIVQTFTLFCFSSPSPCLFPPPHLSPYLSQRLQD